MPTVIFGGTKGGVGKTTLATAYATWLGQRGEDVLLVDCDHKQQSTTKWIMRRMARNVAPELPFLPIFGKRAGDAIAVQAAKHRFVVVDSPGYDAVEFRSSLEVADQLIAPARPGYFDAEGMRDLNGVVEEMKDHTKPELSCWLVRNGMPSGAKADSYDARKMALDIEELSYFSLLKPMIGFRRIVWDVPENGQSIIETRAKAHQKTRDEFNAVMQELFNHG